MNKLLTKIVGAALGLSMTVGVGVAVATSNKGVAKANASASTFTETPDVSMDDDLGNKTTSSGLPSSGTTGWVTSVAAGSYDTSLGRGYAWSSGADPKITYFSSGTTWGKVIVIASANGADSSLSVAVGGVSYSPATRSVANGTASKNQEYVFEGNSSGNVVVSVNNTGSKSTWILDIGLYEASGSTSVTGVELDKEFAYGHVGGSTISLTATVSPGSALDKSVSWSSSSESVATVNNGTVTLVGPGTTTITVETTDGGFTDTCSVTVFSATHGLQESDPLTIAEAIKVSKSLAAGDSTSSIYYISGEVSSITTAYSTQYGNITLAFTANAETFSAYRALVSQSYGEAIEVGDTILWRGHITNYQGNTYQTAAGGEIITGVEYPEPTMKETTLAGFIGATSDAEKAELYHFSAEVDSIDNKTYGNLTLTDGSNSLTVYGSTATTTALSWGTTTGVYTFTNPQDYNSIDKTKNIVVGDTVEVKFIRYLHNGDVQAQGLIISVTSAPVVTYTVTYNAGGADSGTVPTDSNSPYNTGSQVTVLGNTGNLTKSGYSFAGWSDGTTTYQENDHFTISQNTVLTAQWTENVTPTPSTGGVNYFKLSSSDTITSGRYIVAVDTGSSVYAMTRTLVSGKYAFSSSALTISNNMITSANGSDYEFEFEVGESGISIKNPTTSKYINRGSSTNFNETDSAYLWTAGSAQHGSFRLVASGDTSRVIAARAGTQNKFGPYSSSNVTSSSTEYYDIELYRGFTAEDFANEITEKTSCTVDGSVAPTFASGYSWSAFETDYNNKLTSDQKTILSEAEYTKTGSGSQTVITPASGVSQALANGVAKYDYIVGKYGTSTFADFMSRNPSAPTGSRINIVNSNSAAAIISVIAVLSLSAVAGYFMLRKRKEQ